MGITRRRIGSNLRHDCSPRGIRDRAGVRRVLILTSGEVLASRVRVATSRLRVRLAAMSQQLDRNTGPSTDELFATLASSTKNLSCAANRCSSNGSEYSRRRTVSSSSDVRCAPTIDHRRRGASLMWGLVSDVVPEVVLGVQALDLVEFDSGGFCFGRCWAGYPPVRAGQTGGQVGARSRLC